MATDRLKKKAKDIIASECKGSIMRRFPTEWLDDTLEEITRAAQQGDKSAQTAYKLLNDGRFKKKT